MNCQWCIVVKDYFISLNRSMGKLSNPDNRDKDSYSLKYHMNGSVYELFDELQLLYPSFSNKAKDYSLPCMHV